MNRSSVFPFVVAISAFLGARYLRVLGSWMKSLLESCGAPVWIMYGLPAFIGLVVVVWLFKLMIVQSMPDGIEMEPADAASLPWVDHQQMEVWTRELEAAGFVQLGDYGGETIGGAKASGFGRAMVHPQLKCMAEFNQANLPTVTHMPLKCVIMSHFADEWVLSTANRKPCGSQWVMRRPRGLWASRPDMSPAQMVELHMKHRQILVDTHRLQPIPMESLEQYFAYEKDYTAKQKPRIRRKSAVSVFTDIVFFPFRPRYEWWGELKRLEGPRFG